MPILLTLLLACTGGPATMKSKAGAPFDVGAIQSALWAVDGDSDSQYGSGVLFVSTEEVACNQLTDVRYEYEVVDLIGDASGMFVLFGYRDWEANRNGPPPGWEGLWLPTAIGTDGESYRYTVIAPFHEGFVYSSGYYYYGGGQGWVDVDLADGSTFEGTFDHTYWKGKFVAEDCGTWGGRDTGYGYDYGDYGSTWYY